MSEGDNVWRSDSSGFISGYFIFTNEECNGQIGMKRLHEKLGERIYLGQAITEDSKLFLLLLLLLLLLDSFHFIPSYRSHRLKVLSERAANR
jgi:hypothetical protein